MLSEEEVYLGTKTLLSKNGYLILGGQPPKGIDHIPVIEIKPGTHSDKGSLDSFKPDLIVFKDSIFYIVECKPIFDRNDYEKILLVLEDRKRLLAFYNELEQRNILSEINYYKGFDFFKDNVDGFISYSGTYNKTKYLKHIIIDDFYGKGIII